MVAGRGDERADGAVRLAARLQQVEAAGSQDRVGAVLGEYGPDVGPRVGYTAADSDVGRGRRGAQLSGPRAASGHRERHGQCPSAATSHMSALRHPTSRLAPGVPSKPVAGFESMSKVPRLSD